MAKRAIVLLSGGLDSATTLYLARKQGYQVLCLIFDYGQRHKVEIETAKKLAGALDAEFYLIRINFPWKGSALLDKKIPLPQRYKQSQGIPATYVPARNTIFLSFALSCAEALGAGDIFIGANAVDYSGYPDCRPLYYQAFDKLARVATKRGLEGKPIRIHAPLIHLKKSDIIRLGMELGVPYEKTWSCYKGAQRPCGRCDSCLLRAKGFKEAGHPDPLKK